MSHYEKALVKTIPHHYNTGTNVIQVGYQDPTFVSLVKTLTEPLIPHHYNTGTNVNQVGYQDPTFVSLVKTWTELCSSVCESWQLYSSSSYVIM